MQKDQGMLPTPIASLSLGTIYFISTPTISFIISFTMAGVSIV
jgi:hypothetical protein